jgi:hypothetical protein
MLHHTNTSATVVLYQKIPIPTHISSYQKNTRKAKTKVPISVLISQRIKKNQQYLFQASVFILVSQRIEKPEKKRKKPIPKYALIK